MRPRSFMVALIGKRLSSLFLPQAPPPAAPPPSAGGSLTPDPVDEHGSAIQ